MGMLLALGACYVAELEEKVARQLSIAMLDLRTLPLVAKGQGLDPPKPLSTRRDVVLLRVIAVGW